MRFLVAFLLFAAASAAPGRDESNKSVEQSQPPSPTTQDSQDKKPVEGGTEQVEAQEPAKLATQGQGREETQEQEKLATQDQGKEEAPPQKDIFQDDDWEKGNVKAEPHEPTCTGAVGQVHLLTLQGGNLMETQRTIEYDINCSVDVDIKSEKGDQLAVFHLSSSKLCTLELCKNGKDDDITMTFESKNPELGKELQKKAKQLLNPHLETLISTVNSMLNAAMVKYDEILEGIVVQSIQKKKGKGPAQQALANLKAGPIPFNEPSGEAQQANGEGKAEKTT